MAIVKTHMKEADNVSFEAQIHHTDTMFSIKYFVNGNQVNSEEYPDKTAKFVESTAASWLAGINVLNG